MALGTEESKTAASREPAWTKVSRRELTEILEQHRLWLESHGEFGAKADLSSADLAGVDFTGANLRGACLNRANLRRADLSLADLRGAQLIQADLREANFLGTTLRDANLQGANLEEPLGLQAGHLAGADLSGATLPQPLSDLAEVKILSRTGADALRLLGVLLVAVAFAWTILGTTTDARLIKNAALLSIPRAGDVMPLMGFYLAMPVLLFGFYVSFHFYLKRIWEGLADLPAILPDGRLLDRTGPWLWMALARDHFPLLRENRKPLAFLETWVAQLMIYWLVPVTLFAFWVRYLTRQDFRGTMLHVLLVAGATSIATLLPERVGKTLRGEQAGLQNLASRIGNIQLFVRVGVAVTLTLLLSLVSLGTIFGMPHDTSRAPEIGAANPRRWAANLLWTVGSDPYAQLTEADISTRPANWSGRDEDLGQVKGARLNGLRIRCAEAYRVFFVNAHLWKADLRNAFLSEADMRGANLRQASLRAATLDRARLFHANLQHADLQESNLTRADLREADLSYAALMGTRLVDARLGGANLYGANLERAWLLRADLQKADLREANLERAKLDLADLSEAYLWSAKLRGAGLRGAQLQRALLIEADLRSADLRGTIFRGATLRGAEFAGADLAGADLREVIGLDAGQICSATERRGLLLDEVLQSQVESRCGAGEK